MYRTECLYYAAVLLQALSGARSAEPAQPTSIYIDLVPGYKNLSACAEVALSTLIRNMWNGCADNSDLTSYSCFCTDSYSKFSWDISTAVVSSCGSGLGAAQAKSAVCVFHNYCANGTTQLTTTAVATITDSSTRASGTAVLMPVPSITSSSRTAPGSTETAITSAAARTYRNIPRSRSFSIMIGIAVLRMLFQGD